MQRMYQTALDACRNDAEREEIHPLTAEKLEDFGILCKDGRDYAPTHAFTLLTKPTDRNIKIQCALFKGVGRDEFKDKKAFRGPIQSQVEDPYPFVLRHINRSAVIDGLYRHDSYEFPTKSIREVIANACLHRSYLDSSAIQVSIYDDRIEVDSPGMLYDGLNVTEALSGRSKCRNKAIAEAFQYMKIIEMLKADEKTTQKKLSEELGISLRTVKRNMTALQEKGIIARVGSNNIPYHNSTANRGEMFDRDLAEQFDAPNRLIVYPGEELELLPSGDFGVEITMYDFSVFPNVDISGADLGSLNDDQLSVLYTQARYCQTMTEADLDTLREIVSEDMIFIHMSGRKQTREEYFADILDGSLDYHRIGIEHPVIEIEGDRASITYTSVLNANAYGAEGTYRMYGTHCYELREGVWVAVNR